MTPPFLIRPIEARDDAAMAAIIRAVMPEFGATGCGFAINDPEVDWMHRAYAAPRSAYFVVERDGAVQGGGGVAPLESGDADQIIAAVTEAFTTYSGANNPSLGGTNAPHNPGEWGYTKVVVLGDGHVARADAHRFYEGLGYERTSVRLSRDAS